MWIDQRIESAMCVQLRQTRIEYDAKQLELIKQQRERESQSHLVNLNEDPMLSGVVIHMLKDGMSSSVLL